MKIIIILLLSISSAMATCPKMDKLEIFNMKEKFFSIGTNFKLKADGKDQGSIEEKALSWGRKFTLRNKNKELVARAKEVVFSWGNKVEIFDCNDNLIGSVEEKVSESFFSFKTKYTIKNKSGKVLAESIMDSWGHNLSMKNKSGSEVVSMSRDFKLIGGDNWRVRLAVDNELPFELLVFAPAFKTAADNSRE